MLLSKQNRKTSIFLIALLFVLSLPILTPLLHKGFFPTDDGEWMVIRFSAFYQALKDGQIPVRWLSRLNFEYGYPVANFLYPGFMYLAVPIKLLGFEFVDTIKIILGLSMIGSGMFVFLWLSKLFNRFSAFVAAIFYLYAPYHVYDLYKRGSVGEMLALAVVPFIFWQIERNSFFWTALGIGFLIISHNTLALLFLPLIVLYMGLNYYQTKDRKLIYMYTGILIMGLGLAAFFWIPAVFDLQYTVFSSTKVSNWTDYFSGLDQIGTITPVVFFLSIAPFLFQKIVPTKIFSHIAQEKLRAFALFFAIGLVCLFLSLPVSWFVWHVAPVSLLQFPFRFLSVVILSTSVLSAFILEAAYSVRKKSLDVVLVLICFLSFQIGIFTALPKSYFDKGEGFYATNVDTTTVKNEYMPKWVNVLPKTIATNKIITNGSIKNLTIKSSKITFTTESASVSHVLINQIYFPGWNTTIDNKQIQVSHKNESGLIEFDVPEGIHTVKTTFTETPVRFFADIISVLSFLFLVLYLLKRNIFRNRTM